MQATTEGLYELAQLRRAARPIEPAMSRWDGGCDDLVAVRPHSAPYVEVSDPNIVMMRSANSERTMIPAKGILLVLDNEPQIKGRNTHVPAC